MRSAGGEGWLGELDIYEGWVPEDEGWGTGY